jgi:hypothetical protein
MFKWLSKYAGNGMYRDALFRSFKATVTVALHYFRLVPVVIIMREFRIIGWQPQPSLPGRPFRL